MKDLDFVDIPDKDAEEEIVVIVPVRKPRKPRLNRFARKRQHKRELKLNHARRCGRYSIQHDEEREKYWNGEFVGCPWYSSRNDGYEYWHRNYLSGCRKYAKSCTNRRIRSKYRMQIRMMDPEDIMAPQCSDYEKEFDYLWTIY